jgi:DNA gyrase/topoisomerase IV subunit A
MSQGEIFIILDIIISPVCSLESPKGKFMAFNKKIDEWMKEAEERPASAVAIVKSVANRLRELTERNEELLAENIALENGTRVEEYRKQIAHLEYQLELLKRRFGVDDLSSVELPATATVEDSTLSILIYNARGRVFRVELNEDTKEIGHIDGDIVGSDEPPRILAVPSNGEVSLLFTSGRIETYPVGNIPTVELGDKWKWDQAALPDEPRAGELLACISPFSHLPLSDFFLQISRRGCAKKTMTSLAQSILGNHYIGKGALQKSDQPFDLMLCQAQGIAMFVTYEGKVIALDVDELSYAIEERIRLSATDYVIASFIAPPDATLLCVTQNGKVIQRESKSVEASKSSTAKGQALIPSSRLEQGVRFMGAAAVQDGDKVVALDATGRLKILEADSMTGAGSIEAESLILSIGRIPADSLRKVEG